MSQGSLLYWVTPFGEWELRDVGKEILWGACLVRVQLRGNWNKLYKGTEVGWKLMHCYLDASQISYPRGMAEKRQLEEIRLKHQLWGGKKKTKQKKKSRIRRVLQTMLISRALKVKLSFGVMSPAVRKRFHFHVGISKKIRWQFITSASYSSTWTILCGTVLWKKLIMPRFGVTEFDGWLPLKILEALLIFLCSL